MKPSPRKTASLVSVRRTPPSAVSIEVGYRKRKSSDRVAGPGLRPLCVVSIFRPAVLLSLDVGLDAHGLGRVRRHLPTPPPDDALATRLAATLGPTHRSIPNDRFSSGILKPPPAFSPKTPDDAVTASVSVSVSHITSASNWKATEWSVTEFSLAHWQVLEAAVAHGYYKRPRVVSVADLTSILDEPRSTVQYRLRTAEDRMVSQFVEQTL